MDEYNINEMSGQSPKENPFKKWSFYVAYLVMIVILVRERDFT